MMENVKPGEYMRMMYDVGLTPDRSTPIFF